MCCDIGEYALKIEVFFKRSFKKRQYFRIENY